jgi:hypothetical protein
MRDHRGVGIGIGLVGVGVYALLSRSLGFTGPAPVLLLLGSIFFVLSALSRFRGPLLPAGILMGLGAGMLLRRPLEPWMPHWTVILLGIGSGFLFVAAIDRAAGRQRQPNPVVPGVVLTGIALAEAAARAFSMQDLLASLEPIWPFAVLAAGLLLIFNARRQRST